MENVSLSTQLITTLNYEQLSNSFGLFCSVTDLFLFAARLMSYHWFIFDQSGL